MRSGGWPSSPVNHFDSCRTTLRWWRVVLYTAGFGCCDFQPHPTCQDVDTWLHLNISWPTRIWCHKEVSGSCRCLWRFGLSGSDSTRGSAGQYLLKHAEVWGGLRTPGRAKCLVGCALIPGCLTGWRWSTCQCLGLKDLLATFPAVWFGSWEPRLRKTEGPHLAATGSTENRCHAWVLSSELCTHQLNVHVCSCS